MTRWARFVQSMLGVLPVSLREFVVARPLHEVPQEVTLAWLAEAHAESEATTRGFDAIEREEFGLRMRNVLARCAPGPDRIASRGCVVDEVVSPDWEHGALFDLRRRARGAGIGARTRYFADVVAAYFERAYAHDQAPPRDLIHVTCTGYVSPSGAQRLVADRRWPTRVTHAYHMGCYAAMPAVRLADGLLQAGADAAARVDIVHTELCSLHLDPGDHRLEQLVVQSLFADGFIRYTAAGDDGPGLRLLAAHEAILPDSADAMSWIVGDTGMQMTLARDVPDRIAGSLHAFVAALLHGAGRDLDETRTSVFAVHPGGPKIIDRVRDVLQLEEAQVATSRGVLRDHGNMSSATLPHIWMRVLDDVAVAAGSLIVSLAFGPGLTVCGALFEKR